MEAQDKGDESVEQLTDPTSEEIYEVLTSDDIESIYTNGFTNVGGDADVSIIFQRYNKPILVVNMPYELAKSLAQSLGQMTIQFEDQIGREISTPEEVQEKRGGKS